MQPAAAEVVVVVTSPRAAITQRSMSIGRGSGRLAVLAGLWLVSLVSIAAVLPEDRADGLYHYYNGGGIQIDGPSLLVRKKVANNVSVSANYYVDNISSASIDVVTTASKYEEKRTQMSLGIDYLHDDTIMSASFTTSDENDYAADTMNFSISQEVFSGLTTITMGYGRGSDVVTRRGDNVFSEDVDRRAYRLGLSQVITRNLLVGFFYETITDEGFLNNPYRTVRYIDSNPGNLLGYAYEPEVYPGTRTSNAGSVRARYHLPYRAAVYGSYRYYTDTWDISAHTAEVGYTHTLGDPWVFDFSLRYYTQTKAEFYSDLFPFQQAQNFLARDKEMSTFSNNAVRLGVSYDLIRDGWSFIDRGSINLIYERIMFNYDDFRDLRGTAPVGEEPLYGFDADVIQLFFSIWF